MYVALTYFGTTPARDVRRGLAGPPRACVAFTDCVDVPPVHGVKHATAGDRKVLDVRLRARADGEKSGTARSGRSGGGAGARSIPMKDALAFACIVVAAVAAPATKPVQLAASPNIWTLGSVLSSSEAEEIRKILEAKEETAWDKEAPGVGDEGYQTTHARASCLLYVDEVPALRKVLDTFSAIWKVNVSGSKFIPALRDQESSPGFMPHFDGCDISATLYLNSVPRGYGDLYFFGPEVTISPEPGRMVTWGNYRLEANGTRVTDEGALHTVTAMPAVASRTRYTLQLQAWLEQSPDLAARSASKDALLPGSGG